MKKTVFCTLCVLLCLLFGVSAGAAASRLTVTYKKKTVTLYDTNRKKVYLTYPELKAKWGAAYKQEKKEKKCVLYTYKKGKSSVKALYRTAVIPSMRIPKGYTSYIVSIGDKNMKLNGISVGNTKAKALSRLRTLYGKKNVLDPKGASALLVYFNNSMPLEYRYNKRGVITSMSFFCP